MRPHLQRRAQLAVDAVERGALAVEAVVVGDVRAAAQQDPRLGGDQLAADHVEPLAAADGQDGTLEPDVLDGVLQRRQIFPDVFRALQPALVARHPGQLHAGGALRVRGHLKQPLQRPAAGPAALVTQLDQHPERPPPRVPGEQVEPRLGVGEAQQLELGVAVQLGRRPGEPRGIDHLVGHHDAAHAEAPDGRGLPQRRHREPPRTGGQLHRGDLRRHVRLGVRRQLQAVIAGEGRHRGDVVLQRVAVHHHRGKLDAAVEDRLTEDRRHHTPFVRVRPYPNQALRPRAHGRSARPGVAPVSSPRASTGTPETSTSSTPSASVRGAG
ncbi:hypothetical protein GCM10020001_062750 [Nonomuraea salmonea]